MWFASRNAPEHVAEVRDDQILDLGPVDGTAELARERCDAAIGDAAGDDQVEVVQIGGHVERKTMARHPSSDTNADGSQLVLADPDASQARHTSGCNPVVGSGAN